MICPYCNNEMQQGYIQCRDGVVWMPEKQWIAALSSLGRGAVPLGNSEGVMQNKTAIAYHCKQCQTIIIPYGKEER